MDLCFVETKIFETVITNFFSDEEFRLIQFELLTDPKKGNVIKGTGGARKIRIGSKGKGKRGGARIIYYYQDDEGKIWFLAAYMKNRKTDLTEQERKWVAAYIAEIKEAKK